MKLRIFSNFCLILTIGFALTAMVVRVNHSGANGLSRETLVLVFPVFLALMTKRTTRYPKVGALTCFIALCLSLTGLQLALGPQ
jgi:hypothetical protein